jgi:hypothetical protein
MNVGELVAWGTRMIAYLDEERSQRQGGDPQRVEQAVGWGRQYRQELEQWRQGIEVGTLTEHFVKTQGLSADGGQQFQQRLTAAGSLPQTQRLGAELIQFVTEEGSKAKAGERLIGSSEGV